MGVQCAQKPFLGALLGSTESSQSMSKVAPAAADSACLISGVGRGRGEMAVLAVDSASGT